MKNKKFRNSLCLLTLTVLVSLLIASCPLGQASNDSTETDEDNSSEEAEEDPNVLTVTGTLGSSISIAKGDASRGIGNVVSHIASIPIIAGQPGLGSIITTPVNADGTFSMDIPKESGTSTLFLMENKSSESLEERTQGFLSLNSTNGVADLVLIPTDLASRSLDFGTVTLVNGVGVGSRTLESQKDEFTIEFDKLLETAYHDDLFKHIKNQYVNTDHETGDGYSLRTRCYFTGKMGNAENQWFDKNLWTHTEGFNIRIDIVEPKGYSFNDIETGTVDVEVIPPYDFTLTNLEPPMKLGPSKPILASMAYWTNIKNACAPPWVGAGQYWNGKTGWVFEFDGREDLKDGNWRMNLLKNTAKTDLAVFDMQSIDPFTPDGKFIYYVPSFRIITEANKRISRIDLAWYAWNPYMTEYERVTDLSTLLRLGKTFTVSLIDMITDQNGNNTNDGENFNDSLQMFPTRNWYLGDTVPLGGTPVDWLVVCYSISSVEYTFTLYP